MKKLAKAGTSQGALRGWITKRQRAFVNLQALTAVYQRAKAMFESAPERYSRGRLRQIAAAVDRAQTAYRQAARQERSAERAARGNMTVANSTKELTLSERVRKALE